MEDLFIRPLIQAVDSFVSTTSDNTSLQLVTGIASDDTTTAEVPHLFLSTVELQVEPA